MGMLLVRVAYGARSAGKGYEAKWPGQAARVFWSQLFHCDRTGLNVFSFFYKEGLVKENISGLTGQLTFVSAGKNLQFYQDTPSPTKWFSWQKNGIFWRDWLRVKNADTLQPEQELYSYGPAPYFYKKYRLRAVAFLGARRGVEIG
jgi:hypothetical protein